MFSWWIILHQRLVHIMTKFFAVKWLFLKIGSIQFDIFCAHEFTVSASSFWRIHFFRILFIRYSFSFLKSDWCIWFTIRTVLRLLKKIQSRSEIHRRLLIHWVAWRRLVLQIIFRCTSNLEGLSLSDIRVFDNLIRVKQLKGIGLVEKTVCHYLHGILILNEERLRTFVWSTAF